MSYTLTLPDKAIDREVAISQIINRGKRERNIHAVKWWLGYYYLQGARKFSNINYEDGSLEVDMYSEVMGGDPLSFKYEAVVEKILTQIGRYLRMDITPQVKPSVIGLDAFRKASLAQVVLDAAFASRQVAQLQSDIWWPLLTYGTIGLSCWVVDTYSLGIEIVPPWELLPIPAVVTRPDECRGLIRRRMVPLQWVKDLNKGPGPTAKIWEEMDTVDMPIGEVTPSQAQSTGATTTEPTGSFKTANQQGGKSKSASNEQQITKVVEFAEVWTYTQDNYLDTYTLWAGGKEVWHQEYKGEKRCPPISIARHTPVSGFWGRGYIDTLIPLNSEVEYMASQLFQNVTDMDAFGILAVPTTLGIPADVIHETRNGLKILNFEPDYTAPDLKPFAITPVNAGLAPGRTLEFAKALLDEQANQPKELLSGQAPGRVDNSAGLGMLMEASDTPLTAPAASVTAALIGCYRYILDHVGKTWDPQQLIKISTLDDNIAGISIDPISGSLTLEENNIPHPDEVIITLASAISRSPAKDIMQLQESLKQGIIDPTEFRILVRKKNLDYPVGSELEWQNYRRATLENILLFGDGKKPNIQSVVISNRDVHKIHLMVLEPFMARPEFYLSSPEVRTAFEKHRKFHLDGMGVYPDNLEYPEDAAGQQDEAMKAQQQGGGAGGLPPELMAMMSQNTQEQPPQGGPPQTQ